MRKQERKMAAAKQGSEQAYRFSSPHEEVLINLMRSADCLHRAFQQRLKPSGLTATQYNVLRILRSAHPSGLTCSAIGRMMITPEPDITRLLGRLKAQKFVCQQRDTRDRRIAWTYITAEGLHVLKKLDGIVDKAPRELLKELSSEELHDLKRLLAKARCCGGDSSVTGAAASVTGKPPLPRSSLLHPRPE
jgi:DNA-binding MarR family transcriptional regulator